METTEHTRWALAFALAAAIWAAGMAGGLAVAHRVAQTAGDDAGDPAWNAAAVDDIDHAPASEPAPDSGGGVFWFVLGRNANVFLWLLSGLVSAGAVTFMVLLYNGMQLGLTIGFALQSGVPPRLLVDLLLTHGVLEMGAFFVAGAVGLQGARLAWSWSRLRRESLRALHLGAVLVFGVCALTGAAAIEAFVTLTLVDFPSPRP